VEYDEFVTVVERSADADRGTAERAAQATLGVLGEHLGRDECRHLVPLLPPELGAWLFAEGPPRRIEAAEFVARVAAREHVDQPTGERHTRAVFVPLGRALPDDAYAHMMSRLSRDYAPLLPKGPYAGAPTYDDFVARVAAHTDVGTDIAHRATEAVLETLAERIAAGEVYDLMSQLPIPLHAALKRGRARADTRTGRMPVDEFILRTAERAKVPVAAARRYARAVFTTLRETVRGEFFDITNQLPNEYWDLATPQPGHQRG
jgi:uncharacterized protein (DUF2267 family)